LAREVSGLEVKIRQSQGVLEQAQREVETAQRKKAERLFSFPMLYGTRMMA